MLNVILSHNIYFALLKIALIFFLLIYLFMISTENSAGQYCGRRS